MRHLMLLLVSFVLTFGSAHAAINFNTPYTVNDQDLVICNDGQKYTACAPGNEVELLKAFPTAYGFGANSVGGRGGTVLKVTNLNDSGAGSFRAAVEASGPRIVVFETSGIINLQSPLTVSNPYLTIAGQTSPSGIFVTGHPFRVSAAHVTVRHTRFRVGSHETIPNGGSSDPSQHDAIQIWGNGPSDPSVANIIFDHVSVGWGIDENFEFAYNPTNITIQNSIISEGLTSAGHSEGTHSMGMLVWNPQSPDINLTIYNNFFAHNRDRNPEVQASTNGVMEIINNISFNFYGGIVMTSYDETMVNWIGNYARRGTGSNTNAWEILHYGSPVTGQYVYVDGNRGLNDSHGSEWRVADDWDYSQQDEGWRRLTAWGGSAIQPPITNPSSGTWADAAVLSVGATVPVRDSIDQRAVDDFLASATTPTGSYLGDVAYPGDFPTFGSATPPADTDNDGMSDAWETANGLNVGVDDSATIETGELYTNIERYINELAGD